MARKQMVAYMLQVAGAGALIVAAALVSGLLGWLAAGVLCMVFGVVLEREAATSVPATPAAPADEGGT